MDKFEYKVRAEEIKNLIAQGDYGQAAELADTIDWRRVKSVMMLCTISDVYKINRRYEDARDMLLLAYERRPGGRNICYSLCELSIKTGEFVQAMEYYKEFVQVAPRDPGRYILQYKLYEDQDVSLEERIEVLEELKKHDYREKWAYELAYLYHRVGLAARCVEECDEMILWFGEGDYVIKAMELKMLHQPLNEEQQEKYDHRFDQPEEEYIEEEEPQMMADTDTQIYQPIRDEDLEQVNYAEDINPQEEVLQEEAFMDTGELDIQVKTMDMSQYNTMNLQAELAQGLRDLLNEEQEAQEEAGEVFDEETFGEETGQSGIDHPITRSIMESMFTVDTNPMETVEMDEVNAVYETGEEMAEAVEPLMEEAESSEVFFGETGEIALDQIRIEDRTVEEIKDAVTEMERAEQLVMERAGQLIIEHRDPVPVTGTTARMTVVEPPKELAHVLSQESDGQISLVVPEEKEHVEKQITGQMNIAEVLEEWERWKKQNEEKHKEEVRQRVLQQTGNMFTEFEAAVRDGLLEKLEKGVDEPEEALEEISEVAAKEELSSAEALEPTVEEIQQEEEDVREFVMIDGHSIAAAAKEASIMTESVVREEAAKAEAATEDSEEFVTEEIEEVAEEYATEEIEEAAEEYATEEIEEVAEEYATEETEEAAEEFATEEIEEVAEEYATEGTEVTEKFVTEEMEESVTGEMEDVAEELPVEELEEPIEEAATEETLEEEAATPVRSMTPEEMELYGEFAHRRSTAEQILRAVDNITLAAYTGNVIITSEAGVDAMTLAKNMIREVQATDNNFSGKVAKISGQGLNRKNVAETLNQLQNGALIIQTACDMDDRTIHDLYRALQNENLGIVVMLVDDVKIMNRFLVDKQHLLDVFTARVDVKALSNDMLVAYGKQYAKDLEYAIDELGLLALHTSIEDRQTLEHAVTTTEVEEIVNDAIRHASRKTPGHFFSILFAKRYDEEDMIIVTEKDFV